MKRTDNRQRIVLKKLAAASLAGVLVFALAACDDDDQRYETTQEATVSSESDLHHQENASTGHTAHGSGGASGDIGRKQAQAIALDRVPGATASDIVDMEREHDDGRLVYEGTIYYDGYEYEFEIDGITGNILTWEIDD